MTIPRLQAVTIRTKQLVEAIRVLKTTWRRHNLHVGSWLVAVVFAWQLVYLPLHLLLDCHYDHKAFQPDSMATASNDVGVLADEHCGKAHGSGHVPHCVSDHTLPASTQPQMNWGPLDVVLTDSAVEIRTSHFCVAFSVFDRCSPPGRPPPGPSLPRAPPLA